MSPIAVARDVTARGFRTRIVECGSGPALVLVHDFLASHRSFDPIVEPLARIFRVIAIDLPGFGDSEKPLPSRYPYSPEAFADVLVDVLAALRTGRCHLLGHGLGAAVALTVAADHAEFVDRLVLVAPTVYAPPVSAATRTLLLPLLGPILFKQLLGRSLFRSYFQSRMYAVGHSVPPERLDHYFACFNAPSARESAYAALRNQLDTRPSVARLTRVKAPTLLLCGRADALLSPTIASRMVRQLASAQLEFVDSGHSPHEEQPERVEELVELFLLKRRR